MMLRAEKTLNNDTTARSHRCSNAHEVRNTCRNRVTRAVADHLTLHFHSRFSSTFAANDYALFTTDRSQLNDEEVWERLLNEDQLRRGQC